MSIETHRVAIGACGWKHAAWLDEFYAEDLPEDWQLGFYSNEYSVVYVPASDWLDHSDLEEWGDDVSESFRFILEIPAQLLGDDAAYTSALKKAKGLSEFCLGLVFLLDANICNESGLFQSRYREASVIAPVCVDKSGYECSADIEQILLENNISELWNGKSSEVEGLGRGRLAITRISSDDLDMRSLRAVIETCLSVSSDDCISVLVIEGEPPSLEMMRNADTLLNLL